MLAVLTAAAFLVFAQAFMVAPILPRLGQVFGVDVSFVGLAVPGYLIPYGVATLIWGPVADRLGRRPVIVASLVVFVVLSAGTATADGPGAFVLWRMATGAGASGIVPIGLALIGDVVPYRDRGRAIGWLFGGMAGGMAVGSTAGALAEPFLGWRGLFLAAALTGVILVAAAVVTTPRRPRPAVADQPAALGGYLALLRLARARRTYAYVGFNAVLHSGIYTWLGLYLHQRFALGPVGVGLGLLGYGVPGFLLGPLIGRLADRYGRARLIPAGVAVGALAAFGLAAPAPLVAVGVLVALLSLGYDLTQPLLAGIVTDLPGNRGQAVAFMAVTLFTGFGAGSLLFSALLPMGFPVALAIFGLTALAAAAVALPTFTAEQAAHQAQRASRVES